MVNPDKIAMVEQTAERLNRAQGVVLVDYQGLTVADMNSLRLSLRNAGSELKVVKNRLTKRSLEQAECESLDDLLTGAVALAFGYDDPTGPAKACAEFAKGNENLEIKGGLLGKERIDASKILALSKLPGRTELLTQMASTMLAPARQLATAMNQSISKIVYAMQARADQLAES